MPDLSEASPAPPDPEAPPAPRDPESATEPGPHPPKTAAPHEGVLLLHHPSGRVAPAAELVPYLGGLYLPAEIAEFKKYNARVLPLAEMPRTVRPGPSLLRYRRLVYGPYGYLGDSAPKVPDGLFTFRTALHLGQTKLCAVELEALTRAVRRFPGLKYVVYAGAAPA
jgi:hypothetical protein